MRAVWTGVLVGVSLLFVAAGEVQAQPLGSFTWQLQPYCNRVTVNVRQDGGVYTLDGTDDQCGAAQKAPVVGVAAPNPDGSIGFGFNIVSPSGQAVPVQARMSVATLSGTWRDSGGNTGTFAFGGNAAGSPRPVPTAPGDITEVAAGTGLTGGGLAGAVTLAVDPTAVQRRVTTACPAGQALRSIAENGTAVCEPITGSAGGDITAVNAGAGLTGGGLAGDVELGVDFGGTGIAASVARSDHTHALIGTQNTAAGHGALAALTTGSANTAFGAGALGANGAGGLNVAIGSNALRFNTAGNSNVAIGNLSLFTNQSGAGNVAVGGETLRFTTTGNGNVAVGNQALRDNVGGSGNVALGNTALRSNTSGTNDIAVGGALLNNTTGSFNVGVGNGALSANVDGTHNVGVGQAALFNNTSGGHNVAVGAGAGNRVTSATYTTLLGDGANLAAGAGALTNATAIGARAQVDQSDSIVLGSINAVNGAPADTRVGIGTTAPQVPLDVVHFGNYWSVLNVTTRANTPAITGFMGRHARGTPEVPAAVQAGDTLAAFGGVGHDGTAFAEIATARVVAAASENWTPTSHGSRLSFMVGPNLSTNASSQAMVIDHNGRVGIGTNDPPDRLDVFGDVRVGTSGTNGCLKNRGGGVIVGTCSSDERFKRDITPFGSALDRVAALRPVHYFWRREAYPEKGFGPEETYGLVAQEVEAVLPELVTTDADGYRQVDYAKLPLLAIQAIRELKALVDDLAGQNQALRTIGDELRESHRAMEQRVATIEALLATGRR